MLTAKAKTVWIMMTGQMEVVRQRSAPQVKPPQKVSAVSLTASGHGPSVAFLPRTSSPESKEVRIMARTGPLETNARHNRPRKTISSPKVATATVRNAEANEAGPDPKTPPERINAHTSNGKMRSRRFFHCEGGLAPPPGPREQAEGKHCRQSPEQGIGTPHVGEDQLEANRRLEGLLRQLPDIAHRRPRKNNSAGEIQPEQGQRDEHAENYGTAAGKTPHQHPPLHDLPDFSLRAFPLAQQE